MKPKCEPCLESESKVEFKFSTVFGEKLAEDIIYGLFNPRSLESKQEGKVNIKGIVESYLKEKELELELESSQIAAIGWSRGDWREKYFPGYSKLKAARAKAWEYIADKVKKGEIKASDLSPKEMIKNFPEQIVEEFTKEDFLDVGSMRLRRDFLYPDMFINLPGFTAKAERLIAKRVLEEAFLNLEKQGIGMHEIESEDLGIGIYPSHKLQEYDEQRHSYDMLDIQESLLSSALHDPKELKLRREDILIREPYHLARTANVILLDISFSMDGEKFIGAVMAALALRELLQREYKEDALHIFAYNHEVRRVAQGELTRLRPIGYTDIGLAIDIAAKTLEKEDANRSIFLITDSEPTASATASESPVQSALRAAREAGRANIRLNLIMLDRRPELKLLCEEIARVNGRATVTFVEDPLNLKEFIIKRYMEQRAQ
jgi:Mg-chelatase subunit ChlD